jgi:hypothetical protein
MSYAASLLNTYPSILLSDAYVHGTALDTIYPSGMPPIRSDHWMNDTLELNYAAELPTVDHSIGYMPSYVHAYDWTSRYNSEYPLDATWPSPLPKQDSFLFNNDITEYSESMTTASNTASSVARTIDDQRISGTMNKIAQHVSMDSNPMYTASNVRIKPQTSDRSGSKLSNAQSASKGNKVKINQLTRTDRSMESSNTDRNHIDLSQVGQTKTNNHGQPSTSIDIHAWLSDSQQDLTFDNLSAEQAWSSKVQQLQIVQAQRDKGKKKYVRSMTDRGKSIEQNVSSKKPGKTPVPSQVNEHRAQQRHVTYLDSLLEGNHTRTSLPSKTLSQNTSQQVKFKRNPSTSRHALRMICQSIYC